jgi:pimeloyl-ACP methyl ester carboxylesterase
MRPILIRLASTALAALLATAATAQVAPFPDEFREEQLAVGDAEYHVRMGGSGPAVVLLHGYQNTGDMWAPLAAELMQDHTVIVPDLRGLGLSSRPEGGYEKVAQAADLAALLDEMDVEEAHVVGHDIGNMVAFAFAASHPHRTTTLTVMDAPIPGVGPWDEITRNPALWHFSFGGPDAEQLVEGRERIYLDRLWNAFAADPAELTDATREHYARAYAQPGAMRAGFAQFAAFAQDAEDNRALLEEGPLSMPVLAVGGEASFGSTMAAIMREAATDVTEVVIPNSGHWLMEEEPDATVAAVAAFLDEQG